MSLVVLKYVSLSDGKKLYFKRSWNNGQIRRCYKNILLEQDALSPHRYLTSYFGVAKDDYVIDIGCADANFSLSIVDEVANIYLFEVDKVWIEALKMTFKPWGDKTTIINSFVSDVNDDTNITIYNFAQKNRVTFIKADVKGNELLILRGGKELFSSEKPLKMSITTYHRQEHAKQIYDILSGTGFGYKFSHGYIIPKSQVALVSPYLR